MIKIPTKAQCEECERVFDLLDEEEASEWFHGHDCEDVGEDLDRIYDEWRDSRFD